MYSDLEVNIRIFMIHMANPVKKKILFKKLLNKIKDIPEFNITECDGRTLTPVVNDLCDNDTWFNFITEYSFFDDSFLNISEYEVSKLDHDTNKADELFFHSLLEFRNNYRISDDTEIIHVIVYDDSLIRDYDVPLNYRVYNNVLSGLSEYVFEKNLNKRTMYYNPSYVPVELTNYNNRRDPLIRTSSISSLDMTSHVIFGEMVKVL